MLRLLFVAILIAALTGGLFVRASWAAEQGEEDKGKDGEEEAGVFGTWLGGADTQFFRLPPFHVPVIRNGKLVQQVSLLVTLETRGATNKSRVIEKRQQLQGAFLRDIHGVLSLQSRGERPLNVETMKIRLKRVADRVLGAGVARAILVEAAHTRRFE